MKKHKYDIGQLVYFRIGSMLYRSHITLIRWEANLWHYIADGLPDWIAEKDVSSSLSRSGGRG